MTLTQFLFSFRGRINRAKYWLFALVFLIVSFSLGLDILTSGFSVALLVSVVIVSLLMIYTGLAVGAKRLHDRNRSAWWLVVFYLVPGVLEAAGRNVQNDVLSFVFALAEVGIYIWMLVELGCLRGTPGPNQYGPDPLARAEVPA
jgi:uncharacterized membrane protein YhaH (DUF805 family)